MLLKRLFLASAFVAMHVLPCYSQVTASQFIARTRALNQIRSEALSAIRMANDKQYRPERDEWRKINPARAKELPELHLQQQQIDQRNIDNAKMVSNKFVDEATAIALDIRNVDQSDATNIRQASILKDTINQINIALRPEMGVSALEYVDPAKIQALELALADSTKKIDEILNASRAREQAAKRIKDAEDSAGQIVLLYSFAEACQQANSSFNLKEIESLKFEVKKQLDALSISKEKREEQWAAAQYAIAQSGLKNLPPYQLSGECNRVRGSMTYAYPAIFMSQNQLPKSPF